LKSNFKGVKGEKLHGARRALIPHLAPQVVIESMTERVRTGFGYSTTKAFGIFDLQSNVTHAVIATDKKSLVNDTDPKNLNNTYNRSSILPSDISAEVPDAYALQASITKQQSTIKQLKKDGASADLIEKEVKILLDLREKLAALSKDVAPTEVLNRKAFDELILRKMYVIPSFEIHNGPAGLFDYGPPACALKANIFALWRQHFVLEENMLEMECTNLTPSSVLETSGHVERFTDFMVRDVVTGECFRADKLLEETIDNYLLANPSLTIQEKDEHLIIQVC